MLFSAIPHTFRQDSHFPEWPLLHFHVFILLPDVLICMCGSNMASPQVVHFLNSSMSLDSFTIHFFSAHPVSCSGILHELPELFSEVEQLGGTKLESARSVAGAVTCWCPGHKTLDWHPSHMLPFHSFPAVVKPTRQCLIFSLTNVLALAAVHHSYLLGYEQTNICQL